MSSPVSAPADAAAPRDVLKPDFGSKRKHWIFNDEHDQLRESIHNFVVKELAPHHEEWERETFPDWVFQRMGELGFLGLDKPEKYGGQGGDYFSALVLGEAIAHANCGGLAMGVAGQTHKAEAPRPPVRPPGRKQHGGGPARKGGENFCPRL